MRIAGPTINEAGGTSTWESEVTFDDGSSNALRYEVPSEHRDLISDRLDAALVALLIPAMRRGEGVRIEGPVTGSLVHRLQGGYQKVLATMIPGLSRVDVSTTSALSTSAPRDGVATGFSGGIDSFCVMADNYLDRSAHGPLITHLLFHNVGSHGHDGDGESLFRHRYNRLKPLVDTMGLPYVPVNSNLDAFYLDGFQRTHTARNASVAHLLGGGIGRYLYASTLPYGEVHVSPTYDIAYADPILLPLLSSRALQLESSGSEYTRIEKTMRVAEIPASHTALDVCVRSDVVAANCSSCWKCLRTLLTFEIGGVLDRFSAVFDLELYERRRERYMSTVLISRDPRLREVVAFAEERDFRFPVSARLRMPVAKTSPAVMRFGRQVAPDRLKDQVRKRR